MSSWLRSVFPLQVTGSVGLPVGSNRLMVFPRSAGRVAFLVRRIFVQRGAVLRRNQFFPFPWRLDRGAGRVGA
jgi:hypothetical protein